MSRPRRKPGEIPPHDDLVGQRVSAHLTVAEHVGYMEPNDAGTGGHQWRCACNCGGSIVLLQGDIKGIIARGVVTACRECSPRLAAERRKDLGSFTRMSPKAKMLARWHRYHTLYTVQQLSDIFVESRREMKHWLGFGTSMAYTGPVDVDTAAMWQPPSEEGGGRIAGGMSLDEIADALAAENGGKRFSRERVRQIEATALLKLARALYAIDPMLFDGVVPTKLRSASASEPVRYNRAARARKRNAMASNDVEVEEAEAAE